MAATRPDPLRSAGHGSGEVTWGSGKRERQSAWHSRLLVAAAEVAFATDSVVAAVWAIAQDIGGSHVASTLAWSNMWGNFGASAVAKLIPFILGTSLHYADWREIFWICAGGFVLLGTSAMLVDSSKPLSSR